MDIETTVSLDYEKEYKYIKEEIFKINREKNKLAEQNKVLIETIKILCEVSNE